MVNAKNWKVQMNYLRVNAKRVCVLLDAFGFTCLGRVYFKFQGQCESRVLAINGEVANNGMGSGYAEFISGWRYIFFPYLKSSFQFLNSVELNRSLHPWQETYFSGPEPANIPAVISSVPVDWDYHDEVFNLNFRAGITGVSQDPSDGTLAPVMSWFVTHVLPPNPFNDEEGDY